MITPAIINVAYKRIHNNNPNRDIQLSEYFVNYPPTQSDGMGFKPKNECT
jgi:hypothetical protein